MNQENKPLSLSEKTVDDIIEKVKSEDPWKFDCNCKAIEAEREKVRKLVEAITRYTEYNYSAILDEALKEIEEL